jgi:hypothetical protein
VNKTVIWNTAEEETATHSVMQYCLLSKDAAVRRRATDCQEDIMTAVYTVTPHRLGHVPINALP